jgi:hypothetical protein
MTSRASSEQVESDRVLAEPSPALRQEELDYEDDFDVLYDEIEEAGETRVKAPLPSAACTVVPYAPTHSKLSYEELEARLAASEARSQEMRSALSEESRKRQEVLLKYADHLSSRDLKEAADVEACRLLAEAQSEVVYAGLEHHPITAEGDGGKVTAFLGNVYLTRLLKRKFPDLHDEIDRFIANRTVPNYTSDSTVTITVPYAKHVTVTVPVLSIFARATDGLRLKQVLNRAIGRLKFLLSQVESDRGADDTSVQVGEDQRHQTIRLFEFMDPHLLLGKKALWQIQTCLAGVPLVQVKTLKLWNGVDRLIANLFLPGGAVVVAGTYQNAIRKLREPIVWNAVNIKAKGGSHILHAHYTALCRLAEEHGVSLAKDSKLGSVTIFTMLSRMPVPLRKTVLIALNNAISTSVVVDMFDNDDETDEMVRVVTEDDVLAVAQYLQTFLTQEHARAKGKPEDLLSREQEGPMTKFELTNSTVWTWWTESLAYDAEQTVAQVREITPGTPRRNKKQKEGTPPPAPKPSMTSTGTKRIAKVEAPVAKRFKPTGIIQPTAGPKGCFRCNEEGHRMTECPLPCWCGKAMKHVEDGMRHDVNLCPSNPRSLETIRRKVSRDPKSPQVQAVREAVARARNK